MIRLLFRGGWFWELVPWLALIYSPASWSSEAREPFYTLGIACLDPQG